MELLWLVVRHLARTLIIFFIGFLDVAALFGFVKAKDMRLLHNGCWGFGYISMVELFLIVNFYLGLSTLASVVNIFLVEWWFCIDNEVLALRVGQHWLAYITWGLETHTHIICASSWFVQWSLEWIFDWYLSIRLFCLRRSFFTYMNILAYIDAKIYSLLIGYRFVSCSFVYFKLQIVQFEHWH